MNDVAVETANLVIHLSRGEKANGEVDFEADGARLSFERK